MDGEYHKVGLNFIVGLSGTTLEDEEKKLLGVLRPAGVILFAHNLSDPAATGSNWPETLKTLIADVRDAIARDEVIVSIDHEGGNVHRLKPKATHFPPARNWHNRAFDVALAMGRELRALGCTLDFAPVLDIDSNPANTVIHHRAFGVDKQSVAEAGRAFYHGLQSQGIAACGKHFPGHGATTADSHLELPVLSVSKAVLMERDLYPFKVLIEAGLRMIMTAHVLYTALDKENPATVSKKIVTTLLRTHLGFTGTVVSDAMEMNALGKIALEDVGVKALSAGVDLLLVAKPKEVLPVRQAITIAKGALEALERNVITEPLLRESHKRVNSFLTYCKDLRRKSSQTRYDLSLLGCDEHQKLCKEIAES